ncbi:MAG: helix-turn-helix domain-containing protein [Armatimonadota bacterium]|nr:helix-turn-helix domain-containing protein [Armatimonadota bacterium]
MACADDTLWPEVLTVDQAAAYLQVHRHTVYRYIGEGQLPAAQLGKVYRLFRRDVDAFLDGRRTDAARRAGGARDADRARAVDPPDAGRERA